MIIDSCIDPMHDILEGIALTDMALIIKHYIALKYFSIWMLNDRLHDFDYVPNSTNKPDNIAKQRFDNLSLRLTAAQSFSLIFNFNLLDGHLIPDLEDDEYRNFIVLRKITFIAFKKVLRLTIIFISIN